MSFFQSLTAQISKVLPHRWFFKNSDSKKSKIAQFAYQERQNTHFGTMRRPMVTVSLWSPIDRDWHQVMMLIDTGADVTVIPRYLAAFIGLDLQKSTSLQTSGIGGNSKLDIIDSVHLKIGSGSQAVQRTIPVGITAERIPPLLGRQDALESFGIYLDKKKRSIFYS